ncbi:MAG: VWA domain-containing protein [Candidatus Thorarchaeota archaeon]
MAHDIWGLGEAWNPITFSAEFIHRMRAINEKLLGGTPSTRQAIAIPKLLTARFHRKRDLIPEDYIQAAVFTTPIIDQPHARDIAFQILFPERRKKRKKRKKTEPKETPFEAPDGESIETDDEIEEADRGPPSVLDQIMSELSVLGESSVGFDDIESMVEHELDAMSDLLDFLETLSSAETAEMEAFRSLLASRGGDEAALRMGLSDKKKLEKFLRDEVLSEIDSLPPEDIEPAAELGWGEEVLSRTSSPWEKLAMEYAMELDGFRDDMEEILAGDMETAARSLKYLKDSGYPKAELDEEMKSLVKKLDKLWDISDVSDMLEEVPEFDKERVFEDSLEDLARAFRTASKMDEKFGTKHREELFDTYDEHVRKEGVTPTLDDIAVSAVESPKWEKLAEEVFDHTMKSMKEESGSSRSFVELAEKMKEYAESFSELGSSHAGRFDSFSSSAAMKAIKEAKGEAAFLDLLDSFMDGEIGLSPTDVMKTGLDKGFSDERILERIGDTYETLKHLVESGAGTAETLGGMMRRLGFGGTSLSMRKGFATAKSGCLAGRKEELLKELTRSALKSGHTEALAAMAHADLTTTLETAKTHGEIDAIEEFISEHPAFESVGEDDLSKLAERIHKSRKRDLTRELEEHIERIRTLKRTDSWRMPDRPDPMMSIDPTVLMEAIRSISGPPPPIDERSVKDIADKIEKVTRDGSAKSIERTFGSMTRGPGENLILQWFNHRKGLPKDAKDKVKELAKQALIEVAMSWPTGKIGSGEKGLAPSTKTRPFRDGDDIDQVDIESSIESILMSGKDINLLTRDDLVVWDTVRGRVAACFLLDISGSMSGEKLAMCAIAVVMLVANLLPEEVAIAFFEESTHAVKGFEEKRDLDEVAEQILDLRGRRGTSAEAAFRWAADQIEKMNESEKRLVMVLTDAFVEDISVLEPQLDRFNDLQSRFIVALNEKMGNTDRAEKMAELTRGEVITLGSLHEIPKILTDVLNGIK